MLTFSAVACNSPKCRCNSSPSFGGTRGGGAGSVVMPGSRGGSPPAGGVVVMSPMKAAPLRGSDGVSRPLARHGRIEPGGVRSETASRLDVHAQLEHVYLADVHAELLRRPQRANGVGSPEHFA